MSVEPKPVQRPHPPVYIGGYSEDTVRWTAARGYHLIQHGIQSRASVMRSLRIFGELGGDVHAVPVGRFVYVGESDDAARREIWPTVLSLTARLRQVGIHKSTGIISEEELESDRFVRDVAIVGGPATCADKIAALQCEVGLDYLNALSAFFGYLPPEQLRRSLSLLAREVMPRVGG